MKMKMKMNEIVDKYWWSKWYSNLFSKWWYCYVFEKPRYGWREYTLRENLSTIYCRMRGHPCGPVYYNSTGYEPDMSCKNCGDEL